MSKASRINLYCRVMDRVNSIKDNARHFDESRDTFQRNIRASNTDSSECLVTSVLDDQKPEIDRVISPQQCARV